MILRPYKLLVIAKVQDGDTPVNVDPCAVQGLNIWVKPEPHIRWAYNQCSLCQNSAKTCQNQTSW